MNINNKREREETDNFNNFFKNKRRKKELALIMDGEKSVESVNKFV